MRAGSSGEVPLPIPSLPPPPSLRKVVWGAKCSLPRMWRGVWGTSAPRLVMHACGTLCARNTILKLPGTSTRDQGIRRPGVNKCMVGNRRFCPGPGIRRPQGVNKWAEMQGAKAPQTIDHTDGAALLLHYWPQRTKSAATQWLERSSDLMTEAPPIIQS